MPVWLIAAPGSKFARFHSNQGITLLIVDIAVAFICSVLGLIPILGIIFIIIGSLAGLVALALAILGIINAANGKAKELPLIGQFNFLK